MTDIWNGFRVVGAVEDDTRPEPKQTDNLADRLQGVLADASTFYHTVHEFHWNVTGSDFYQYHKFFDEIVSDVYDSIDPIAENIRKLGGKPVYRMQELSTHATIQEPKLNGTDTQSLSAILVQMNGKLIETLKNTFDLANEKNEQGVANFIAERIDQHQKWQWFLESSVGK
jgi:starvation-inducible DNA-binding protein